VTAIAFASAVSTFRLEQVGGPELVTPSLLLGEKLLLGRGTDCTLVLPDAAVSRRHALIELRGGQHWLTDLESRAGTFINDLRLDAKLAAPLHEHDRIRIGAWRFRVRASALRTGASLGTGTGTSAGTSAGLTQVGAPVLAAQARLELLVEFVAACADKGGLEELADTLLDFASRATQAPRLSIWAIDAALPLRFRPDNFRAAALVDAFAACARGGVVIAELPGKSCAAVVAVRIDGEAIAFVQAEFAQPKPSDEALESLHALARLAGFSAGNIERRSAEKRIERLSSDLQQAHQVQQAMLPARSGVLSGMQYALHVHPGRVVAGDLVDVFALNEVLCAIVLGDVSGAGFGAAVQMASAQAYLHAELMETRDPAMAATRCNAFLMRVGGGRFVTAWIGVLNTQTGAMTVVDAGHGHARLVQSELVNAPELHGAIPLGIDSAAEYRNESLLLPKGARLVLYSDGIAEHRGLDGSEFSAHMGALLKRSTNCESDVKTLLAALEVHAGRLPDDDATILSVAW
jgi:phosphoserine phosphatase RsbU/P